MVNETSTARETIGTAARAHGWTVEFETSNTLAIRRGAQYVTVQFNSSYIRRAVSDAQVYEGGGKREAVLAHLAQTVHKRRPAAEATESYKRAFAIDLTDPAVIERFEAIWKGQATGFGEVALRSSLDERQQDLRDLCAGQITATSIIGPDYKPEARWALAVQWLNTKITEGRRDLASRGRTNPVNIRNVKYHLRAVNHSR